MTESFDADWLALREPIDHRSRAAAAMPLLEATWRARGWSRVLDLGSGTGSNLRYLAPRLPGGQCWTLVDRDRALLDRVTVPDEPHEVVRTVGDLADTGLALVRETGAQLVTCSALLDLVSESWLTALVTACREASCGAHFAMTYDGSIQWLVARTGTDHDDDPDDTLVRRAVNSHQRRDKGLGVALGPMASLMAETRFREAGYRVWLFPSPWRIGPDDAALAGSLVDGWTVAAGDECPGDVGRLRAWATRRRATVASGAFGLTVGHLDLLALPPDAA